MINSITYGTLRERAILVHPFIMKNHSSDGIDRSRIVRFDRTKTVA
jgi:hypothetical protein